jgi:ubiquinol-cytochrome c reductase cytochrome b subunit
MKKSKLPSLEGNLPIYRGLKRYLRKIFPDHWSFLLGEAALYSFVILLITGTWLALFFDPSEHKVLYHGSYTPLENVPVSEAYNSTLTISLDTRAGLFIRQLHHWSALIFIAAIMMHMFRIFFTGAFRKPRQLNYLVGFTIFICALAEGFFGYSLPDDLLSGTGLRIAQGIILSVPLIGEYVSNLFFNGEFPGTGVLGRFFIIHVFLLPFAIAGLLALHLALVIYYKHTQWPGKGATEKNVVGQPIAPIYALKAGGFFLLFTGIVSIASSLFQINPVWLYGPYTPDAVSAGSQPDWYIGFLEGALRITPNLSFNFFGYNVAINVLTPALLLPGIMFTALAIWPYIDPYSKGSNLLQSPRYTPIRTAFGVTWLVVYTILLLAGGNDLIAFKLHLSLNLITRIIQFSLLPLAVLSFFLTILICNTLQKKHGSGIVVRDKLGGYREF